jgi:RNA 3'-terminal phosphate cyclase (ATP)
VDLVAIDGSGSEGGGQVLRTALALSVATGRGFELTRIRAQRLRPGLQPQQLAAVRAAAMACNAEVHGGFDGSPDLRFLPHDVAAGEFSFDIGGAGAATLVLQTVVPILALAGTPSRVSVLGGTHVPRSPSFDFLARHWAAVVEPLGIVARMTLVRAGFVPRGEGRIDCEVCPWPRPAKLDLVRRGALVAVRGVAGASHLRGDVAQRASAAARELLWEARRLETEWDVVAGNASSPGSYLQVEGIFEQGRAAFAVLGERGQPPELMGERAARRLLAFVDEDSAVVDPWLADQLAVPLALARGGGRLLTSEVSSHLERVAAVLRAFGVPAETRGRRGGPGELEVGRW